MGNLLHEALDSELRRQRALALPPSMPVVGVPTGFRDLDNATSGFRPGEVALLLGENDVGKTTLLLDMAANAAIDHHVPTAFLTSRGDVYRAARTLLSGTTRLGHNALAIGDIPGLEAVEAGAQSLREAPLVLNAAHYTELPDQLGLINEQLGEQGPVQLVIVDGLKPESTDGYRPQQRLIRDLKELAPKYSVPALVPLTVGPVGPGFPPMLPANPNLKELLDEVDVVLTLERDELKDPEGTTRPGEADLSVVKHPVAAPRIVGLAFMEAYPKFANLWREYKNRDT